MARTTLLFTLHVDWISFLRIPCKASIFSCSQVVSPWNKSPAALNQPSRSLLEGSSSAFTYNRWLMEDVQSSAIALHTCFRLARAISLSKTTTQRLHLGFGFESLSAPTVRLVEDASKVRGISSSSIISNEWSNKRTGVFLPTVIALIN